MLVANEMICIKSHLSLIWPVGDYVLQKPFCMFQKKFLDIAVFKFRFIIFIV